MAYLFERYPGGEYRTRPFEPDPAGNFGDCKSAGGGVEELRIDFAPGYRVYYGRDGSVVVVLLGGGDKRTQTRDVPIAQQRWREYLDAKING